MTTIQINTNQPLFFRDSSPNTFGETVFSKGIFPPYPSTIYGGLRNAFWLQNASIYNHISKKDPTIGLKLNKVFLHIEGNPGESNISTKLIFPFPSDLFLKKGIKKPHKMKLFEKETEFKIGSKTNKYLSPDTLEKLESTENIFLDEFQFQKYLEGNSAESYINLNDYSKQDGHIGIALTKQEIVKEGALFKFNRRLPYGKKGRIKFIVEFENIAIKETGKFGFGSDSPAVFYSETSTKNLNMPTIKVEEVFKWVLATPAIFEKGYLPSFIDGIAVELITYAIEKPVLVGGFDMIMRRPKPAYKAIPAGGVYYLKVNDQTILDNLLGNHEKCISDFGMDRQGFGLGYFAKV